MRQYLAMWIYCNQLMLFYEENWKRLCNFPLSLTKWLLIYHFDSHLDVKSVPCSLVEHRGQRTLAWTWPDQTLAGQELANRQAQPSSTRDPDQTSMLVRECRGRPGWPYCKRLVLNRARTVDTGYYRCYYKDVKAVIDGTTAVSVYVFVRGETFSTVTDHVHVRKRLKFQKWTYHTSCEVLFSSIDLAKKSHGISPESYFMFTRV